MTLEFVRTEPGEDPIIVEGYFAATPATVFRAWTDPNIVMKWFGYAPNSLQGASIDLRPGGAWQFLKSSDDEKSVGFEGEYIEIDPDKRLRFTWSYFVEHANGEREASPRSQVEVNFIANGSGTEIRLVHGAIQDEGTRQGFAGGWNAAFNTLNTILSNPERVAS